VYEQGWHEYWCDADDNIYRVTHWAYLPDPPIKKSEVISPDDFCYRMMMLKNQLPKEDAIPAAIALINITLRRLGYGKGIDFYEEILRSDQ
jgi:hypothetical protein